MTGVAKACCVDGDAACPLAEAYDTLDAGVPVILLLGREGVVRPSRLLHQRDCGHQGGHAQPAQIVHLCSPYAHTASFRGHIGSI